MKKLILLVALFIIGSSQIGFSQKQKEESKGQILKDGDKCPDFELTDINGKKYTLKEFKGYYVYIDFWATW